MTQDDLNYQAAIIFHRHGLDYKSFYCDMCGFLEDEGIADEMEQDQIIKQAFIDLRSNYED